MNLPIPDESQTPDSEQTRRSSHCSQVPYADCIWTDVHGNRRFAFEIEGSITLGEVGILCDFEGCEITFRQFDWQSHGKLAMCCRTMMPGVAIEQVSEAIKHIEGRADRFKIALHLLPAKHQEGA